MLNCIRSAVPAMRARGGGRIVNQTSIGAFGTLLYLCSSASDWVTGQIIRVDGGLVKRAC